MPCESQQTQHGSGIKDSSKDNPITGLHHQLYRQEIPPSLTEPVSLPPPYTLPCSHDFTNRVRILAQGNQQGIPLLQLSPPKIFVGTFMKGSLVSFLGLQQKERGFWTYFPHIIITTHSNQLLLVLYLSEVCCFTYIC